MITVKHLHEQLWQRRHTRLTSSAAFWTVTWLNTRAPSSGQTVFSSSLLSEKSWAPVRTPRLVMVLQRGQSHNQVNSGTSPWTRGNTWTWDSHWTEALGLQPGLDVVWGRVVGDADGRQAGARWNLELLLSASTQSESVEKLVLDLLHGGLPACRGETQTVINNMTWQVIIALLLHYQLKVISNQAFVWLSDVNQNDQIWLTTSDCIIGTFTHSTTFYSIL